MTKKLITLLLVLTLLLSCSFTALAAEESEAMDSRLAAVTKLVKAQLQIGDEFTEFNGYLRSGDITDNWELRWSNELGELSVVAGEDGKILSYYNNTYSQDRYRYDRYFTPAFPKFSQASAEKAVQSFFAKVLRKGEAVEIKSYKSDSLNYGNNDLYLYGWLTMNGIRTSLYINIELDQALNVVSFQRDDYYNMHVDDIIKAPGADKAVKAESAFEQLGGKTELKLQYEIEDYSAETLTAVPRYVPVYNGDWVVDAISGQLLDMDQLYEDIAKEGWGMGGADAPAEAEASADGAGAYKLTEAELSGIAKMEGVLSPEALDKLLRGIGEFGLGGGYTQSRCNYYLGEDSDVYRDQKDQVFCSMNYSIKATAALLGLSNADFDKLGYTPYIRKYFDVNAKTGEVLSLFTSYPYTGQEIKAKLTDAELQQAAVDYLNKNHQERFAETVLVQQEQDEYSIASAKGDYAREFNYQQQVNDILFPTNHFEVEVNVLSGTIDSYWSNWLPDVKFAAADKLVTADAAILAYNEAHQAKLQYVSKPVATTAPAYRSIAELGYSYVYEYMLAYRLLSDDYVLGVDAISGEAVIEEAAWPQGLSYDDIDSSYAKTQIEALAEYYVGFFGDSFLPAQQLNQRDMLELLVSASYYGLIDGDEDDSLYDAAIELGIITNAEKAPDKLISRAELAKTLVKMSGYGKTASLSEIYKCGFADDSSIAKADYGYIAIAKGLGIVKGDQNNKFNPSRTVNRAEAAVMFYNFLNRSI